MSLRLLLLLGCGTRGAAESNQTVAATTTDEVLILGTTTTELEAVASSRAASTTSDAFTTAVLSTTAVSELATTSAHPTTAATTPETTSISPPTSTMSTTAATNVSAVIGDNATASEGDSNSTLDNSHQACSLPTPFPKTFEVVQSTWEAFVDSSTLRGADGKPLGVVRRRFDLLNTKLELSATDGELWAVVNKDWEGNLRFNDCNGVDIASMQKNWSSMPMRELTSKVLGGSGEELAIALQQWKAWPPGATVELHDVEGQQLVLISQERPWLRSRTSVHIVSGSFDSTASTADARTDPRFLVLLAAAHFGVPAARYTAVALLVLGCCCLTTLIACSRCSKSTHVHEARNVEHMTLIEPMEEGYDSGDDNKAQCLTCCSGSKPLKYQQEQYRHGLPMAPRN